MQGHLVPAQEARTEFKVANSRFIATIAPVFSVDEARTFISRIKKEFADATHNVPVYLIGHGASVIVHASDGGEPSGTAGRPALAVLRGSGLGNVAVVITRYFGGTKLGTGGLVRAYSNAVRYVLEEVPRARQVATHTLLISLPYSLFERVRLVVQAHQGQMLEEDFAADVTLSVRLALEDWPSLQATLRDLSHATIEAEIVETNPTSILPLNPDP